MRCQHRKHETKVQTKQTHAANLQSYFIKLPFNPGFDCRISVKPRVLILVCTGEMDVNCERHQLIIKSEQRQTEQEGRKESKGDAQHTNRHGM